MLRLPACTAVLGTGSFGASLIHGALPPALVWPLLVLALGAMAYDVGLRALPRRRPAAPADGNEVLVGLGELGAARPVRLWTVQREQEQGQSPGSLPGRPVPT